MKVCEVRSDRADTHMAVRIDAASFKNAMRTPQGYLRMPLYATRTGVFAYRNADGSIRRELRHPDDVFDPKSLSTLAGIPITNDHPKVMLIDSSNTKDFILGYTNDHVEPEGDYVSGFATIYDSKAIELIEKGKRELSCGYQCEREEVSGEYNGERYDCRQRNIVYNHLALVDKGRAGPNVRLRLDSADAVQVSDNYLEVRMEKIVIDGVEFEVPEAAASAYKVAVAKVSSELDATKARADRAEARADSLETELSRAKEQISTHTDSADPELIKSAVKATLHIMKVADRVLPKATLDKLDDMDNKSIMIEVIKAEAPSANLDGKSDHYIQARFDTIAEMLDADKSKETIQRIGKSLKENRSDGDEFNSEAARQRQVQRAREQYKNLSSL